MKRKKIKFKQFAYFSFHFFSSRFVGQLNNRARVSSNVNADNDVNGDRRKVQCIHTKCTDSRSRQNIEETTVPPTK